MDDTEYRKRELKYSQFFIGKTFEQLGNVRDVLYKNLIRVTEAQDYKTHKMLSLMADQYFVQALENQFTISLFELGIKDPTFDLKELLSHFSDKLFPALIKRWENFHPNPPSKLTTRFDEKSLDDLMSEIIEENS